MLAGASNGLAPLVNPAVAAQLTQLSRYRAAAEMQLYRAVKLLREFHNEWLLRRDHLTAGEAAELPVLLTPKSILHRPFLIPKSSNSKPMESPCTADSPPLH